jgi:hypothetical protein
MTVHSHRFVETYDDLVAFGLNRKTDENTVIYYLQKFSDDELMKTLIPRLKDDELAGLFDYISALLYHHLTEPEYHRLFLKEDAEK